MQAFSISLQPIQRREFTAEVGQERLVREWLAGDLLDELTRGVALAVTMDVVDQPLAQRLEFASSELFRQAAQVAVGLVKELGRIQIAQRIGGKIAE